MARVKVTASILVTDGIEAALAGRRRPRYGPESTLMLHPMVEAYITKGFLEQPTRSSGRSPTG